MSLSYEPPARAGDLTPPRRLSTALVRAGTDPARSTHPIVNVRPNERFVSAIAGGLAVAWGLSRRSLAGTLAATLGSGLIYRGVSGHCHVYQALGRGTGPHDEAIPQTGRARAARSYDVIRSATVQRSTEAVFRAWRQPETFAQVMSHFAALTPVAPERTEWTLHDPLGGAHRWTTEIVGEEANETIRWAAQAGAPLVKNLTLSLKAAPAGRGTEMTLHLRLDTPGGVLGKVLTELLGSVPSWVVDRALGNMKSLLEAGEIPSLQNNPAARASART